MEEEVKILHKATLLEKQGDKYITNFFILDKDCRIEIYNSLRNTSKERSLLISEFINDKLTDIRALEIAGDHIDDNTIRWWLAPDLIDYLIEQLAKDRPNYYPPKRANGEIWGFVGYEVAELPENTVMGNNGCGNDKNEFWTYKYGDYSMWDQCGEPEYEEVELMCDCIRNGRKISSFSDIEKRVWANINGKYAHSSETNDLIPDVLILTNENLNKIHTLFREHKNFEPLTQNIYDSYKKIESIFKKYSHRILHDNLCYNIRMEMYSMRMMTIHDLVDKDFLKLPEDTSKSTFGMNILLK
jgi:hypothetical protein